MNENQERFLEYYKNPINNYEMKDYTHTYKLVNYSCGDEIQVFIKINKKDKVQEISFVGSGCSVAIGTASILMEYLKGKDVFFVINMTMNDLLNLIKIPLSVSRRKCAFLPLSTIQNALKNQ